MFFGEFLNIYSFIASSLVGVQSTAIGVCYVLYVCLSASACLYVRSHISKITRPNLTKFSVRYLWPSLGPPMTALRYVVDLCG